MPRALALRSGAEQPNSRTAEQPNSRTAEQPNSRTAEPTGLVKLTRSSPTWPSPVYLRCGATD
ncbi:hypothetical protein CLH39_19725 [Alcaligenes faecalis]|nr:hypothetical protein CLH39_19725 [Alcaligenes faecalis]